MGEADRYSEYKNVKNKILLGADNNSVIGLFALNIIFFLLLFFIKVVSYFFETNKDLVDTRVGHSFSLPADISTLLAQPWSILSFMFSHSNVLHLVGNMLWLWAFGYILQELYGNKKLFPLYIYGGLLGGISFMVASPFFATNANNAFILGGNASVISIAIATTLLAPNYRFFKHINRGIPLWVLTAIYILIDLAGVVNIGLPHIIAHLGGGLAGYIYVLFLRKGVDTGIWMNQSYNWFMNLFNPNKPKKVVHEKVHYNTGGRSPYNKQANITQQKVDEILDKINQHGFHFLSDEEKNILKKAAEDDL
jgi:membrane associated rhomboid family serine protease